MEKNFKLKATLNLIKFKELKIKIIYSNKFKKITQYLPMKLWLKKIILKPSANSRNLRENLNEQTFTQFIIKNQKIKIEKY